MFWPIPSLLALGTAAVLVGLLLRPKERSLSSAALAGAIAASALLEGGDLAALFRPENVVGWKQLSLAAEAFLPPAWLAYTLTFARTSGLGRGQRLMLAASAAFPVAALFLSPSDIVVTPDFPAEHLLFLSPAGHLFYAGSVAILVTALIQLERTFFALPAPQRWKIKFELMGVGAIISMLVIYDGQALLYRVIDMNLLPARGAALALGGGLIAFSRLRRGGKVAVRISRQLAFRSVVLFLLGLYLVALGLLEEGVRRFGHGFERTAVWIAGLAGGIFLLTSLLSEKYQRKLRVLIHKHFYKSKYDYRRQWLACTERIASARTEGELQETILSLFCETFAVKGAVLYLRDCDSGDFIPAACYETEGSAPLLPRDDALVRSLGGREWVLDLRDSPPSPGRPASFAVPLVFDHALEGIVLLGPPVDPAEAYIYEDLDLMKTLARQAVSTILNLRLADQLVESREMAAAGRVSAYLLHDLKNLVSTLALVVDNAEAHLEDPDFRRDMMGTLGNSVQKMRRLVARLKNLEEKTELHLEECDLKEVAAEAAALVQGEVRVAGDRVCAVADREELGKVVLNLLVNALEAGGAPVDVEVGSCDGGSYLRVTDRGRGMSEEFVRRHLFHPFRTTKAGGFGIGLYQCRSVVEAHGGRIQVESSPGEGSSFTVTLPSAQASPAALETAGRCECGSTASPQHLPVPVGGPCSSCS